MTEKEFKLHQGVKVWNIFFTIFFVLLTWFLTCLVFSWQILPDQIPVFDFVILSLAIFRLIRLFVYDNIFLFLRESFMDVERIEGRVFYVSSKNSLKLTIYKLLLCPWCFGVWAAMLAFFFYVIFPELFFIFIVLAIAALGSLLQLTTNLIGWQAESKKKEVENK